jgi:hypothetical protein
VLRAERDGEAALVVRVLVAILAPSLLGAVALVSQPSAAAQPGRVVDRTFSCATEGTGNGLRDLDVHSHPHTVYPGVVDEVIPSFLGVSSGTNTLDSDLVAVRAGQLKGISGRVRPAGVYAHATRCRAARVRVPLSAAGLAGRPVPWAKMVDCVVSGRVLVRVRGTLAAPDTWARAGAYDGVRRAVVDAKVAIRAARSKKPIAYLELAGSKKTRLWYSGACR